MGDDMSHINSEAFRLRVENAGANGKNEGLAIDISKLTIEGKIESYPALAIRIDQRYFYKARSILIEIAKAEHLGLIRNPQLYYFSTALKLHQRIEPLRVDVKEEQQ